jgi:hypothetical protein
MTEYCCSCQDGAFFAVHVGNLGVTVSKEGRILMANADPQVPMDIKEWTFVTIDIFKTTQVAGGDGAAITVTVRYHQTQPYLTNKLHLLVYA